jgi:hypothetical protein
MSTIQEQAPAENEKELESRAYDALASIFEQNQNSVEIEILPPALTPTDGRLIVQDKPVAGKSFVGIPKKVLVLAFLKARDFFLRGRSAGNSTSEKSLTATAIILLYDPEYLTAANYRKQYLLQSASDTNDLYKQHLTRATSNELRLLNTILCSPLHRQTKSPTLWHHRWWLFETIVPQMQMTAIQEICGSGRDLIESELMTILNAAEKHPNNYYAWQYARRIFNPTFMAFPLRHDYWNGLSNSLLDWCLSHPSDTSGWSFVLFLMTHQESDPQTNFHLTFRIFGFAENVGWRKEALWVFLRTVASMPHLFPENKRRDIFDKFGQQSRFTMPVHSSEE